MFAAFLSQVVGKQVTYPRHNLLSQFVVLIGRHAACSVS